MKLLLVTWVDPWVRSVSTVHRYVAAGRALGHEVAVYGEPHPELPELTFTTDLSSVDLALFAVQVPTDLPDMPYLARVMDGIPRERRVAVDLWGRLNETIRIDHDFNHLEKLDGHLGWEWAQALRAISDAVQQPALRPLRADVGSFLFHGFDPGAVAVPHGSAKGAASAWSEKPYGMIYVGSNWQRWTQVRDFLEQYARVTTKPGKACLIGWDWGKRPDWAIEKGIMGIDTDPHFLAELDVEIRDGVRFDDVVALTGKARFTPVFHRPLFRHLGFVTNRTFETFYGDTLPILMLPREFVSAVYGPAALALVPHDGVAAHIDDAMRRPEQYWDAVFKTREYLALHHSYERRFQQLQQMLDNRGGATRA